jgi:phage-related protein
MGTELATAYVQIIPTAEGIRGKLSEMLGAEADTAGRSAGGSFSSVFGAVAKAGLAAAGAGLTAASSAAVQMAKDAVAGFAEYEQLHGGLETMFEDLAWAVEENASRAFETAGLSANDYMTTVMGFSASLNQSLMNTEGNIARAADLSDQIITDMADNANKMGTSMESIQNAYAGFSKQNYTMLDNLKLGYGGTKEEMERLLADAGKLAGVEFNIENFSDVAEAIHVIQEEMGIAGTTAMEGSTTISGSLAAMGSVWKNLVTGMASGKADISDLVGNVVSAAETAFGNILPVAEQALGGVAEFVRQIAPVIAEKLPGVVDAVLPAVLDAAGSVVSALIGALPSILQVLIEQGPVIINQLISTVLEMLPEIIQLGLTLLTSLAQGIAENLPALIPTVVDVVLQIVDTLTDPETLGSLVDASIAIMIALAEGLIDALPKLIEKGPEIVMNLVDALVENAPKLAAAALTIVTELVKALIENLPELFKAGGEILMGDVHGIIETVARIDDAASEIIDSFIAALEEWDPLQWGKDLVQNLIDGIKQGWNNLKQGVSDFAQGIADFLGFSEPKVGPLSNFHTYAPDMMQLFAKGIAENEHLVTDQLAKSFDFDSTLRVGAQNVGAYRPAAAETGTQEIRLVFNGSMAQLARVLQPELESETKRLGVHLVTA